MSASQLYLAQNCRMKCSFHGTNNHNLAVNVVQLQQIIVENFRGKHKNLP